MRRTGPTLESWCAEVSSRWLLLLRKSGSSVCRLQSLRLVDSVVAAPGVWSAGSVALRNVGFSRSAIEPGSPVLAGRFFTIEAPGNSTPSRSPQTSQKLPPVLPSLSPLLRVPLPDPPAPRDIIPVSQTQSRSSLHDVGQEGWKQPWPYFLSPKSARFRDKPSVIPLWDSDLLFLFYTQGPEPFCSTWDKLIHPTRFIEPLLYASPFVESKLSFYFPKKILVCFHVKHPVQCLPCSWWSTDGKHIAILEKHRNRYMCA